VVHEPLAQLWDVSHIIRYCVTPLSIVQDHTVPLAAHGGGGTRVWVVSLIGKPEPRPVTLKSLDETYDLRWLNDHALVFDRIADVLLYKQSRIWKAVVPR